MYLVSGLWLGVGGGMLLMDVMECGLPTDWRTWVDFALTPIFWPVAVYRGFRAP